jgi:hypothetical protein
MTLDASDTKEPVSKWQETIGEGFGTGKNKGAERKHVVTDERDGSVGGYHTEHWDGRQDATVNVKPAGVGVSVNGIKERVR